MVPDWDSLWYAFEGQRAPPASCRRGGPEEHGGGRRGSPCEAGPGGMEATVERTIDVGEGARGVVSLAEPVLRYAGNPILTSVDVNRVWQDPHLRVVTVHNAGAAVVDGETALLFRSHLRSGMSILGVARSRDGVRDWRVDPRPALIPATPDDQFGPDVDVGGGRRDGVRRCGGRPAQPRGRHHRRHVQRLPRRGQEPGPGRAGNHRRPAQLPPSRPDARPGHAQRGDLPRAGRRPVHGPVPPQRRPAGRRRRRVHPDPGGHDRRRPLRPLGRSSPSRSCAAAPAPAPSPTRSGPAHHRCARRTAG